MSETSVIKEKVSYTVRIIMNNPAAGNVVNDDNLLKMKQYLEESIADDECRVIIIEGKDGIFSRGMDFKNLMKHSDQVIKKEFSEPYKDVVTLIRNCPKPVIGKIDGDVLAGGMGIALSCDIIIATKRSIFGLSEVLFGIIPAYVFPLLLDRVSFKTARFLILSSKRLKAEEAYRYGIVDELVDDDRIDRVVKDYIKRLLFSSPDALALTKKYSDNLFNKNFSDAIDYAQEQLTELLNNKDNIEAIKGFLEGEKPAWAVKYSTKKK